ncbi:MAG: heme-binding protein, partial [bacterium]
MRAHLKTVLATAALAGLAAAAAATAAQGQVPPQFVIQGKAAERLNDRISINSATAERLANTCFDIIRREANADSATIVILNPYGLVVHQHSKDGQQYTSIKITENKAKTALLTREATINVTRAQEKDSNQAFRYDQIGLQASQAGGVPIVVGGQLIGSMGNGGFGGGP